jgi:glycosyltransferase involved in cell wall biosynthesis
VGALDAYKFDFDLLYEAARSRPSWSFVFVGAPVVDQHAQELKKLQRLPNVHIVGTIARQAVPAFVGAFDVCLIPYRQSRYNAASFPLKFWEFMASGKPIVVTGVPELKEYTQHIGYAEGVDSFLAAAEEALTSGARGAEARRSLAAEHSWQARANALLALIPAR